MYVAKSFISTYFSCHLKVYLASLKLPLDWSSTSMRFFLVQNNVLVFLFFFQNNALVERINLLHSLICATIHITIAYIVTISNDDLIFQNNALVDQLNSIVLYEKPVINVLIDWLGFNANFSSISSISWREQIVIFLSQYHLSDVWHIRELLH